MSKIDQQKWAVTGMYHDIKIWIEEIADEIWLMKGHAQIKDGKHYLTIKCNSWDKDGILSSLVQEIKYKDFHSLTQLDDLNYELETSFTSSFEEFEEKITQWIKIKFVFQEV